MLTLCCSSNPTSPESDSPRSKRGDGSETGKGFSLASAWASTSSSESPYWAFSSTGSQKHQRPTSSPRSRTLRLLQAKARDLRKAKSDGRTSTSSSDCRWIISMRQTCRGLRQVIHQFSLRNCGERSLLSNSTPITVVEFSSKQPPTRTSSYEANLDTSFHLSRCCGKTETLYTQKGSSGCSRGC